MRSAMSRIRNRVVLTNKTPTGLNRGFGGPQVYFPLERLVQRIAVELNLDPLDVIRAQPGARRSLSLKTATGALLDSGEYRADHGESARAGRPCRTGRPPRRGPRRRPALRHRLHRRGRAQRLQHGLHHRGAEAGGARRGRARKTGLRLLLLSASMRLDRSASMSRPCRKGRGIARCSAQVVADVLRADSPARSAS